MVDPRKVPPPKTAGFLKQLLVLNLKSMCTWLLDLRFFRLSQAMASKAVQLPDQVNFDPCPEAKAVADELAKEPSLREVACLRT